MITKHFGWLLSHSDTNAKEILHSSSIAFMALGCLLLLLKSKLFIESFTPLMFFFFLTCLVRSDVCCRPYLCVYVMCPKSYLRKLVNVEPHSKAPSSSWPLPLLLLFGIWSRPPEGLYHIRCDRHTKYTRNPCCFDDIIVPRIWVWFKAPKIRYILQGSAHAPPATEFELVFSLPSWVLFIWDLIMQMLDSFIWGAASAVLTDFSVRLWQWKPFSIDAFQRFFSAFLRAGKIHRAMIRIQKLNSQAMTSLFNE